VTDKVGVDFGGTRIKAGVVTGGVIARLESVETPSAGGPEAALDAIAQLVRRLGPVPHAIGVAIPGEVDAAGRCYRLPNVPGFEGIPIGAEIERRLGCAVVVENDSTSAALGELMHGHGRTWASFLLATLGTGVGGGLVLDGKLRRGAHGFAAELGHVRVASGADAWPCACGLSGCLEAYAGTQGLLRRYAELGGRASEPVQIFEAAERGDAAAIETFRGMGEALGIGMAQAQNVVDAEALVFSGGISAAFAWFEPALRRALAANAFGAPAGQVPLLVSELGAHAGLIGAAELISERPGLGASLQPSPRRSG
jgi:glucokinase